MRSFVINEEIEKMIEDNVNTTSHKDYHTFKAKVKNAKSYIWDFEKEQDEFKKENLKPALKLAQDIVSGATAEFNRMAEEVIEAKEKSIKKKEEALEKFRAVVKKSKILEKIEDIGATMEELEAILINGGMYGLSPNLKDSIRFLKSDANSIRR